MQLDCENFIAWPKEEGSLRASFKTRRPSGGVETISLTICDKAPPVSAIVT